MFIEDTGIDGIGNQIQKAAIQGLGSRPKIPFLLDTVIFRIFSYRLADIIGNFVWPARLGLGLTFLGDRKQVQDKVRCPFYYLLSNY